MANLTIRNLDDEVKDRLKIEAARYGRSMEEEVREHRVGSRIVEFFRGLRAWKPACNEKNPTSLPAAGERVFELVG